ncbi:uncharacterized protein LOC107625508 isoform X2 [Arachis ipaensis]|uniref:uncharacterized protein LOC107625508 isoform X2 n=1 Tax=Arachis ipaensis TaxID=130454 RepID=UPI000A2B246D|nr:uncharacterized protein LOC107625508 isoform X2 [Arachis ipaensis]
MGVYTPGMNLVFDDICGKEQFSPRRFNCCLRNRQLEDPHFIRFHLFVQNMRDQLNLEDDKDNDGSSNNAMEDMDANQNERNVDQAPNLSYEDIDDDFELTLWT